MTATPTLRVEPDLLRTVAASFPTGPGCGDGAGAPTASVPDPGLMGLSGGWASGPVLTAVAVAAQAGIEELSARAGRMAVAVRAAADGYQEADERAGARATGARERS